MYSDFHLLIMPYHTAKFEMKPLERILRSKLAKFWATSGLKVLIWPHRGVAVFF